jgi:hypothetical protein
VTVASTLRLLRETNHLVSELDDGGPYDRESRLKADREAARIWRAIVLAPRLQACEALLRNESVPVSCLDSEWVARFGRRLH